MSGFHPDDVPSVGTFYHFQDRYLQRLRQTRTTPGRPLFSCPYGVLRYTKGRYAHSPP